MKSVMLTSPPRFSFPRQAPDEEQPKNNRRTTLVDMKKTPGICLLFALLLLPIAAEGQRIHGFVSAGGTLSQVEGDELKGFRKWGFTGGVGAIASLDRHEDWRLSIEALFTQRGAYNNSGDPYALDLTLNYVDIPLMLHFRDPWGGMLLGLGLNYSRLVQQPTGRILYPPSFFPDTNDMQFLKNDFGVVADIRFYIWRGLMLNIRWQYSLIAVKRDWNFWERDGDMVLVDENGIPIWDEEGKPQIVPRFKNWRNDCVNNSLMFRLIWEF